MEVLALQTDMLFEALKTESKLLRCVSVWLGTASQAHAPTGIGQWLHVLLHYLTDHQLSTLQHPDTPVSFLGLAAEDLLGPSGLACK